MKMFYYTYKITLLKGSLKDHYYFGRHKTKNINDGYAGSGSIILKYYKKYGRKINETYIKEILNYYNNDEELNNAEKNLIGHLYDNDELCLNLCEGGKQRLLGEEAKCKMSEAHKGKPSNRKGKHHTDDAKRKMSEAHKGKKLSEETKQKMANSRKGIPRSEETKQKISETHKTIEHNWLIGIKLNSETKQKISDTLTGHNVSEDTRNKISEKNKGNKAWNKGIPMTDETRKKLSEIMKSKKRQRDEHGRFIKNI